MHHSAGSNASTGPANGEPRSRHQKDDDRTFDVIRTRLFHDVRRGGHRRRGSLCRTSSADGTNQDHGGGQIQHGASQDHLHALAPRFLRVNAGFSQTNHWPTVPPNNGILPSDSFNKLTPETLSS